ncbi:hypothetical protein F5X99DRAFT_399142 [Biscogniauxia marginata]|nr:hypothetical protein F5X99DRAFT_399142 [Biscogniauxia marginata]
MEQNASLFTKPQGLTTFTKFNELPPELRIKIWQHAMPEARTVIVKSPFTRNQQTPKSLDEAIIQTRDNQKTWQSTTQIPALLHVNSEARYEALKHYTLSFGVGNKEARIYVDFSRDTIFFGHEELKPECSSLWASTQDLNKVQQLAVVPEGAWRVLRWKKVDLNSLQKMIFVHDTDKVELGPLSQLIEDASQEEVIAELEEQIKLLDEAQVIGEPASIPESMKKRMQAAREELDGLTQVLPTQWEKKPAVSTAVFRESRNDK